jgi:phage terminase small subunit
MGRGRHPTPAGLRELRGARTRPHHHDTVPDADKPDTLPPVESDVPAPADLQPIERKFWDRIAPILAIAKMLTPADTVTLVDYCRACYWTEATTRRLHAAWRQKDYDVHLIKMLDAQARGWVEKKTSLAGELGLTAIARTKTAWTGHSQLPDPRTRPTSKIAELQARARSLRQPIAVAKPDIGA